MSTKPSSEETPDLQGAFPRLSDAQIAALDAQGQRRSTQPGDVLFAEGDRECDFFVILAGEVASVEGKGTPEELVIAVHGRGRFLGEPERVDPLRLHLRFLSGLRDVPRIHADRSELVLQGFFAEFADFVLRGVGLQ